MCRRLAGLAVMAVLGGGCIPAGAGAATLQGRPATPAAQLRVGFTVQAPGSPAALLMRVGYRDASSPDGKPPPIAGLRIELPAGTRIDTGAVEQCRAGDDAIRILGPAACPRGSRVGGGSLTAMTGLPGIDPARGDVTVFNGRDELVEVVTFAGTPITAGIDRLRVEGDVLVGAPPAVPGGPPDGRTAVRDVVLSAGAAFAAAPRPYVTTPASCPIDGLWRSRGTFTFHGGGVATATSAAPCS